MHFIPAEIIKKKRDQGVLSFEEIEFFVNEYTRGQLPDYQVAALLMAILLNGMNSEETHHLTQAMLKSGETLDFSDIATPKVDKHSTGGVGDKTSLILAPIVAAAGLTVPMISGRGLGHTGGTLDKLESIPGFSTQQDLARFRYLLKQYGLGLIGQTKEICPADKKIYALRDVTGTVESIPLICASIMSKKLAEGIDSLVLDVKFGSGAFMKSLDEAKDLALKLKDIGERGGKKVIAMLTSMEQPLGRMIGNSLEVEECLSILSQDDQSHKYSDCEELSVYLAGAMIWAGERADSLEEGIMLAQNILESGLAYEKFEEICVAQGGWIEKLPKATYTETVLSPRAGFLTGFDTEGIGYASLMLGAGRVKSTDAIDPSAGIECFKKLNDHVKAQEPLFKLYANDKSLFKNAKERLLKSITVSSKPTQRLELVHGVLV